MNEIRVNTRFDNTQIIQDVSYMDSGEFIRTTTSQVMNLKEQGVKEALIRLGWIPPKEI